MSDHLNIIDAREQGLEIIVCSVCRTLYYDLKRKDRFYKLYCTYCGARFAEQ